MKIYISGQITGLPIEEAQWQFNKVETAFLASGYQVVNPMSLPHNHDKSWNSYMKEDLKAMLDCDAIYMLTNHVNSKGAMLELLIAKQLGMQITYDY